VLSDDQPLEAMEGENVLFRSLGEQWLQGHMAIGIVHFLLDEGVELNL
jgi:sulfate adenylyltransferase subunit 1 (EFTu-like GTPase family)